MHVWRGGCFTQAGGWGCKGKVWTRHLAPAATASHGLHRHLSSIVVSRAFAKFMPLCWSLASLHGARVGWLLGGGGRAYLGATGAPVWARCQTPIWAPLSAETC